MRVFLLLLLLTGPLRAQDSTAKPAAPAAPLMTPAVERAVEDGLRWLSTQQTPSGSYGGGAPVATTSLVGLAFLAGGHVPDRSPHGKNIVKIARYLMRQANRTGYISEGNSTWGSSRMHGHGYATLFLAQLYGMSCSSAELDHTELKGILTRAVRLIERAQAPNGGWTYAPDPSGDEGSVTVTQAEALRAARDAGIVVNIATINRAVDYINKSTTAAGHTQYQLGQSGRTSFALTAAGMSVLNYLGKYDNPKIARGCAYLLANPPGRGDNADGNWYFYGNYYAAIALNQQGGKAWETWYPLIRDELLKRRTSNGSWMNAESGQYGGPFGTALALLILQMPGKFLPAFQAGRD